MSATANGTAAGRGGLRDICARTGLSTSTVSLALRGEYGVSEETRRRVAEAARELGYDLRRLRGARRAPPSPLRRRSPHPGADGQAPANDASVAGTASQAPGNRSEGASVVARRQVAIVYPAAGGLEAVARAANYGRYLRGIQEAAQQYSVDLVFLPTTDGDTDPLLQFMFDGSAGVPDGIVLLGLGDEAPVVKRALTRPAPVVLLSRFVPELPCSWVSVDHVRAADLMTEHLIAQGYTSIAVVTHDPQRHSWQRQRRDGYLRAMARHGLTADPTGRPLEAATPGLADDLEALVRAAPGRTAVFVTNEGLALQVRTELERRGLMAPEHYGLAGYDNVADEQLGRDVGLTSIGFPRERMGALAIRIVRDLCDDPLQEQQHIIVAPELHARRSTQRVPAEPGG